MTVIEIVIDDDTHIELAPDQNQGQLILGFTYPNPGSASAPHGTMLVFDGAGVDRLISIMRRIGFTTVGDAFGYVVPDREPPGSD